MSGMSDGVSKVWVLRMGLGGRLNLHGEKTDVELVEHLARRHCSDEAWRERVAELKEAVARVEATCLHNERMDQVYDTRTRVQQIVWAEHGERWVAEAVKMLSSEGKSTYQIDFAPVEAELRQHLGALGDLLDEAMPQLRDDLDEQLANTLWDEHDVDREWAAT